MTPAESLALTRFVRGACPGQKFDEYTPDAWNELLKDLSFADCRDAAINLCKRLPFVGPAEIRDEVTRIRAERIRANMTDPEYAIDDVAGGLAAIRAHRKAVADGVAPAKPAELPRRPVSALLEATAKRLPTIPGGAS